MSWSASAKVCPPSPSHSPRPVPQGPVQQVRLAGLSRQVGVIGLANGRYGGPYSQVSDTVAKLAQALPAKLSVQPVHAAIAIRAAIDGALNAGRDRGLMELKPLLSANVDQDQPLAVRGVLLAPQKLHSPAKSLPTLTSPPCLRSQAVRQYGRAARGADPGRC